MCGRAPLPRAFLLPLGSSMYLESSWVFVGVAKETRFLLIVRSLDSGFGRGATAPSGLMWPVCSTGEPPMAVGVAARVRASAQEGPRDLRVI